MLAQRQLRDLLAKKQRENHAYINTSYNFVCSCDFCRLCNKRDILIAGEIKPGSNTGISVDFIDYLTYDCYVDKATTTGDCEISGSGGEGNDEYQDDYIAMGRRQGSPGLSVMGQSLQLSPAVSHALGIRLQVASPEFLISAAT
nr:hypothetical protein BaRGS_008921 [Batillaria attramentaria]